MCGISGAISLSGEKLPYLKRHVAVMNHLQRHRGPDGTGIWLHDQEHVCLGHRRLSIIDLVTGDQPMTDRAGNWIVFNGEIYNYRELRDELGPEHFFTTSDTEVILQAYRRWGTACLERLYGMFAFALWDNERRLLFCARDRFGIKPFYYTVAGDVLYFASEAKALLPFVARVETDLEGFKDYLTFQFCLAGKTLFKDISELPPGTMLTAGAGAFETRQYWEVYYTIDYDHTEKYFEEKLEHLLNESVRLHLRSDVPIGAYISGGLDSSTVAALAVANGESNLIGFTGKFAAHGEEFDESRYARSLAAHGGFPLQEIDISGADFVGNIGRVIYHLDYPVAGPGSFPQYMVSRLASQSRKVVLGGQGGDEIFGGYTRYLIAYFEQCIKAAIDGTMKSGNFIVTYESIIPNLTALRQYKPLLQEFWRDGLFESMDRRYFKLINRAPQLRDGINWDLLEGYSAFETFKSIFNWNKIRKESYFDLMTRFDFKTLLPALLHVEDRVSMAHGLESRVPLLDHHLVELVATVPSNIKFKDGNMKHIFKKVIKPLLPEAVYGRTDKMGFPTPLHEWIKGEARNFVCDTFSSRKALGRDLVNNRSVLDAMSREPKFGRMVWGLLCLELWQQEFHDRGATFKQMLTGGEIEA